MRLPHFDQIRNRASGIAQRIHYFHSRAIEIEHIAASYRSCNRQGFSKDFSIHLRVIVKASGFIRLLERARICG